MYRVLLIGSCDKAYAIANMLLSFPNIKIKAIISRSFSSKFLRLRDENQLLLKEKLQDEDLNRVNLVISTDDHADLGQVNWERMKQPAILITKEIVDFLYPFLREQFFENDHLRLILNTMRDGLIVVDRNGYIQLINDTALQIIEKDKRIIGRHVTEIIPNSRLPITLQTQEREINKKFMLNNREIVTTRMPLINEKNRLIGAFATFKDSDEIIRLAEENTDLRKIKTMLEAIIYSSEEAISVVDENGKGLIINPAYTKITGLTKADVIGKPASVDISEGESIHMQVLRSRRPIRGAKLKVGPMNREVFVNVAPVIVQGKLKGSVAVIHDISDIKQLTTELKQAHQMIRELEASYTFDDIIGESDEIKLAIDQAKMAARTPATVLLRGSSGTGKELFAHAIHNASDRKHHKFIRVNCAALAESVLESELFGYEAGAFTGALAKGKKGIFEEANLGSVFLDEIGELSLTTQAKLLRVLQEKEIVRVGGTRPIAVDVRIIAATNANLEKKITDKSFREDLYYRLNRLPIYIPSLKERMDDLPSLVQFIIHKVNQLYGRSVESITEAALEKLSRYHWPGNVRELENIISRAVIFMDMSDRVIEADHIMDLEAAQEPARKQEPNLNQEIGSLKEAMENYEKQLIQQIYRENHYNKTKTAEMLDISIRSLYYKLEKYQLA